MNEKDWYGALVRQVEMIWSHGKERGITSFRAGDDDAMTETARGLFSVGPHTFQYSLKGPIWSAKLPAAPLQATRATVEFTEPLPLEIKVTPCEGGGFELHVHGATLVMTGRMVRDIAERAQGGMMSIVRTDDLHALWDASTKISVHTYDGVTAGQLIDLGEALQRFRERNVDPEERHG